MKMLFNHIVLFLTILIVNVWCKRLYFYDDSIGTLDENLFANVEDKSKVDALNLPATGIVRILDTAFQGFSNVISLALHKNYIECLPEDVFHDVQNVENLQLYSNKLRYLHKNTFAKLRKVKEISLNINLIAKLEVGLFDDNVALESLNIQDNLLTYIPDGLFSKLNNLRALDIGSNYIHYIERNSMPSAVPTSLKFLWLWGNRLQSLDLYDSTLNSLDGSNIQKNPLHCDCKLKRLFKKFPNFVNDGYGQPACESPENMKDRLWSTFQESDFVCERNMVHFNAETKKFPQIGETVILACHINLPVGDISITYKNGTNVVEHLRRRRRFPSIQADMTEDHSWYKLTMKNIQAQDAGSYMCIINGKVEREFYLIVDDPSYYEKCLTKNVFSRK